MPALFEPAGQSAERQTLGFEDSLTQAAVSAALASVFRGKFCDAILPNRKAVAFKKEQVIYDVGDTARDFFFLQRGLVRVVMITSDGHELIYVVGKAGYADGQ